MRARLGWVGFSFILLLQIVSIVLMALQDKSFVSDSEALAGVALLCFGLVGAVILRRIPGHKLGYLFMAAGLTYVIATVTDEYARLSVVQGLELPGYLAAAWVQNFLWFLPIGLIFTYGILLFPDGELPSERWRFVGHMAAVGLGGFTAGMALTKGELDGYPTLENPTGVLGDSPVTLVLFGIIVLAALASLSSLFFRYRSADATQRAQLKYVLLAVTIGLVVLLGMPYVPIDVSERVSDVLFGIFLAMFPIACGISILKYRLYDIDVIINRALVYGGLTAILAGAYLGIVFAMQQVLPLGDESDIAVAASTLAVAALFRPVRTSVQGFIDRRFFRHKYDSAATLDSFAARLRNEVELETVQSDLLQTTAETMQPEHASLWLVSERSVGGAT